MGCKKNTRRVRVVVLTFGAAVWSSGETRLSPPGRVWGGCLQPQKPSGHPRPPLPVGPVLPATGNQLSFCGKFCWSMNFQIWVDFFFFSPSPFTQTALQLQNHFTLLKSSAAWCLFSHYRSF